MSKTELTILDNSNIVESYPGITLPLTYSFIKIAYSGVFKGVIGSNLKNDRVLAKFENIFENMIKSYKGRIYYCINNWYSLIDFMPFSKKITPIWQDMMGVQSSEIYIGKQYKFSFWQKIKLYWNLFKSGLHAPRDMKRLERDFMDVQNYFNETYNENLSIKELLVLFHEIELKILDKWYVTLINDMYAFVWTGILKRKLANKGIDVAKYISGITSLESLKPIRTLLKIAKEHGNDADILLNPEVQEYLKIYGDRAPNELKLECVTFRTEPILLERQIYEYASDKKKLDEMIANLERKESLPIKGYAQKRAQLGIKNREISRLNRSRIYGMVRQIFMQIGKLLFKQGYLNDWYDIFYLEINEIENGDYTTFKELIKLRKIKYAEYEKLPPHTRLIFREDKLIDEKIAANWTGEFTGVGTSSGKVTGEAVVLEYPDSQVDVKGKIIVTKTTDPGWVFLLTMASGIIAEKGSLLSHTAIVSRELGIPAVVAVDGATSVIKTGDIVKIDGDTGRVEIVKAN